MPLRSRVLALVAACSCAGPAASDPAGPASTRSTTTQDSMVGAGSSHGDSSAEVVSPPPLSSTEQPDPAAKSSQPHDGPLALFYDALRALERRERRRHVRIMWLGDSHAQADFWPDALRGGLQRRFGNAGPGFVHLGFKAYRHAEIKTHIQGKWRFRPKRPSTIERWGDGAFGLGGILHAGYAERRWATVELRDEELSQREMRWDLCYKFGLPHDAFVLEIGGQPPTALSPGDEGDVGKLLHIERRAKGLTTLKVDIRDGRTDFCGLTIETDEERHPGVVLDNLGINGARYATVLAWDERAWAEEVKRRMPDLFVFEYGGNEAGDAIIRPQSYKRQALALIARARRIRPDVSCLVIGPSDRADAEAKIPPVVEALKQAAADAECMFWNTYQVMGGKGSLRRWRDDERAAPDGVHLKPKGYAQVGALLLADVMSGYRP